jgi:hypothetical protein
MVLDREELHLTHDAHEKISPVADRGTHKSHTIGIAYDDRTDTDDEPDTDDHREFSEVSSSRLDTRYEPHIKIRFTRYESHEKYEIECEHFVVFSHLMEV